MKYIFKYKFRTLFYALIVLGIWLSLDTHFLNFKLENFKDITIFIRALIPLIIFFIILVSIKKENINIFFKQQNKEFLILLLILFITQVPGLIYTQNSFLNITFIINCFTYLFFLYFFINDVNKLNLFLKISFIIFIIIFLIFGLTLLKWFVSETVTLNLYGSWPHGLDEITISENVPRSSGTARNAMVVFIIFSLIIIVKKFNIFNYLMIVISFLLIILTQSRTTVIFFIGYLLLYSFIIIFLNNKNFLQKIITLNLIITIPFIIFFTLLEFQKNKENILSINQQTKIFKDQNYQNFSRPINDQNIGFGSGRLNDWKNIISKNNNYIIGYGAMGDRYLINQSASNLFLYTYASSGIAGLIIIIIFYLKCFFYTFKRLLISNFQVTKKNYKFIISYAIILYFLFRSLAETSFGIFGIDFLIFTGCLYYIITNSKIKI